jgi:hypothetical protein
VVVLGRKKAGTELSLGDDGELGEEGVNHLHHGRTWGREGGREGMQAIKRRERRNDGAKNCSQRSGSPKGKGHVR